MTPRARFRTLLVGAVCGLTALPGAAEAQRCAVAEIEVPTMSLVVGAREQIQVVFRDRTGAPCLEDPPFTATSSSQAIARVERGGYVVGVSVGAAVITVRTGTGRTARSGQGAVVVSAEPPVVTQTNPSVAPPPGTVAPPPLAETPAGARTPGAATLRYQQPGTGTAAGVVANPARMDLLPGEQRFLGYQTADITGARAEPLPLQFAVEPSSALRFVTIDSIGVVTALDTGTATIRISAVGRANVRPALVPVTVREDSVVFARSLLAMAPGTVDTVRLRVPGQNRDMEFVSTAFQYTSSDTTVARVHLFQPVVEARAPGRTEIVAANPRLRPVTLPVVVFPRVTAIQLSDSTVTIAIRQTRRVVMRPVADTTYVRLAPVTTRGLDTTRVRAQYDSATGSYTLTGVRAGQTAITMRVLNGRDSAAAVERTLRIRVVEGSLLVSRARVGLGPGERSAVGVTLLDDRRQPIVGVQPELTWSTTADSVARYDNGQVVAGRAVGRARLTGRPQWDSTAVIDVFVVPDALVLKQRQGAWNIFGRVAASGAWTQITSDSLIESFPTWSPDLTRIAYVVRPAGRPRGGGDLYVASANGSDPVRIFGVDSAQVYRPQFLRDQIVFELSYFSDGRSEAWSVGADGRNARRLPLGVPGAFVGYPAVSPNGQRILYVSLRPGPGLYDIYMAAIDGTGERRLTTYGRADDSPAWAPDGNSFFFLRDEGEVNRRPSKRVYRFDLANDSAYAVSPPGTFVSAFAVSGDGRSLALNVLDPQTNTTRIATMEIAGGTLTVIPSDPGEFFAPLSPAALRPVTPQPAPTAPPGAPAAPAAAPPRP